MQYSYQVTIYEIPQESGPSQFLAQTWDENVGLYHSIKDFTALGAAAALEDAIRKKYNPEAKFDRIYRKENRYTW